MKELTRAEEQVMQILWRLKSGFVKNIIAEMPDPKPAYNTVSTIIRILEQKGFVKHKAYGKTYEYYPAVDKAKYSKFYLNNFLSGYFSGSFESLVSFFAKENDLDVKDMDDLMKHVKDDLNKKTDD
ncbi:MAG: BlaI/MecI/CopY family transcriptional regulator [Bacteroidota bacterium]